MNRKGSAIGKHEVKNAEARMKNMINAIFFSQLCTDYNTSTSIYGSLLRELSLYDVYLLGSSSVLFSPLPSLSLSSSHSLGCLHSVCTTDDFRDLVLHPAHSTTSGCAISVCRHLNITSVPRLLKLTNVIKLLLSTCMPGIACISLILLLESHSILSLRRHFRSVVSFIFRHSFYFNFCCVFLFITFNVLHECVCACVWVPFCRPVAKYAIMCYQTQTEDATVAKFFMRTTRNGIRKFIQVKNYENK